MQSLPIIKFGKAEWAGAALAVAAFLVVAALLSRHFVRETRSAPVAILTVTQHDRHFHPNRLRIAPGAIVRILNQDNFIHHVYVKSPIMNFDSGDDPIGASVDVEFDHSGTYDVQCAIHPLMHLWVIVH